MTTENKTPAPRVHGKPLRGPGIIKIKVGHPTIKVTGPGAAAVGVNAGEAPNPQPQPAKKPAAPVVQQAPPAGSPAPK